MRNELAKLGNKLDSMGLFKEADSIDGILKKISQESIPAFKPGDNINLSNYGLEQFMKNLNVNKLIDPIKESDLLNRLADFLKENKFYVISQWWSKNYTDSLFADRLVFFLGGMIDRIDNIIKAYVPVSLAQQKQIVDVLPKQLISSIQSLKEIETITRTNNPSIDLHNSAYNILPSGQSSQAPMTMTPDWRSGMAPISNEPAHKEPSYQAKPAPKPTEDPWVTYSKKVNDGSMSIKAAWLARAKATKTDPSYRAYQQWLVQNVKESRGMTVTQVVQQLNAETYGASMPSARDWNP